MIDSTEENFQHDVLDASHRIPVLVDFWAPWCGPCRALGPLLEKLEAAYEGRFRLVKVNSDQSPDLAAQFNVRSIPYVVAFVDGKPVNAFVGALPESQLRAFIDALLPNPSEIERRKALALLAAGQPEAAAVSLRAALALNPAGDSVRWDLAQVLIERLPAPMPAERLAEAAQVLDGVSRAAQGDPRHRALRTQLASLARAAELPQANVLEQRVAQNPADLQARLDLANLHIARHAWEPALEQLLAVVERDRAFGDDIGRKSVLSVFELMADQPALVSTYRRRLASLLNR
jgi:putative thioredoxin